MMWAAGVLASVSSITYPAISSFVSTHADADKQGSLCFNVFIVGCCGVVLCVFLYLIKVLSFYYTVQLYQNNNSSNNKSISFYMYYFIA